MNYTHLSIEERCCIRKYYNDGLSMREISRLISRSASTVARELKRNRTHELDRYFYYPHTAEKKYRLRRRYCHRGMYTDEEIVGYVGSRLEETWSPEQIACTPCGLKVPTARTIYRWLYEGYVAGGDLKVLRRKGRSRGEKETRGRFNAGKSIRKRPKDVYSRSEIGHWELDTMVGGHGRSRACFATFAERKTRYYIAVKMPDRTAKRMEDTVVRTLSAFPPEMRRTITCDRGSEFANWKSIEERPGCKMYFADPYCAWQKGTNENSNGLLREFYPKGRDLGRVSEKTLKKNLALLNARPRKVLGFRSPTELFESELKNLSKCCTWFDNSLSTKIGIFKHSHRKCLTRQGGGTL